MFPALSFNMTQEAVTTLKPGLKVTVCCHVGTGSTLKNV